MSEDEKPNLATLTVQLLSAYVGNNAVPSNELADLIRTTKAALAEEPAPEAPPEAEHRPVVSVKASLASRNHIISLIDGKPYKSLKRHLSTRGLSPDEYRARYKLPSTYPMVAPGYSELRRRAAKQLGLGRKKAGPPAGSEPVAKKSESAKASAAAKPVVKRLRKSSETPKPKIERAAE